jgi:hypothetical protein
VDAETRRTLRAVAAALRGAATAPIPDDKREAVTLGPRLIGPMYGRLASLAHRLVGESPLLHAALPLLEEGGAAGVPVSLALGGAAALEVLLAEDADPAAGFAGDLFGLATDLLGDDDVNAAAPVVLVGAAVEQRLRSRLRDVLGEEPTARGIEKLASALRQRDGMTKAAKGRVDVVREARNRAAHGDAHGLTLTEARAVVAVAAVVLAELDGVGTLVEVEAVESGAEA